MNKTFINKIFSLPRILKVSIIIFLDLLLVIASSYFSLVIRLDQINLFNLSDARYLISIEFFLIPIFVYFLFSICFQFYRVSFRYYNLDIKFYYLFPMYGIVTIFLNILLNDYFSFGAVVISIFILFFLIVASRKMISKIYFIFQNKFQIETLLVCNSKNLFKIFEYLKLNKKISLKAIIVNDYDKIDFKRFDNFKIIDLKNINSVCEKHKIKAIYADKFYDCFKNKFLRKTSINILQIENLFKKKEIDIKKQFVDEYFGATNKIKNKILKHYRNKTILITGAGGSIGKNLFFELVNSLPKKIILVEQDELKLFNLKKEFEKFKINLKKQFIISFKLGNLSNDNFLKNIFKEEKSIDYVLHAAAYKHVGFGEENILSFVKNNIFVTYNLAKMSVRKKVKKFIFISTDKAVNPKSIMGYSKSFCEKILIYLSKKNNLNNVIKIVRFGNVINSDGSVLPIFENQILSGGPVTVTSKDVTRYFMSIKNACQLVLNTIAIDRKIGIFILEMGKPYKILDIAKSMINFYFERGKAINKPKIIFIGLQKGEKIKEELVLGKNLTKTNIKNILYANEKTSKSLNYNLILSKLNKYYFENNKKQLHIYLKKYA